MKILICDRYFNAKELVKISEIRGYLFSILLICGKKYNSKELVKICEISGKPFFKFDKKKFYNEYKHKKPYLGS